MGKQVTRIHQNKRPTRRHFLAEWMELRSDMQPMELVKAINDFDTSLPAIDKSQVYRWLKGQLPQEAMMQRLARALDIEDPETGLPDPRSIMRDPNHDWLSRVFHDRTADEIRRMKAMVEMAFPPKRGSGSH